MIVLTNLQYIPKPFIKNIKFNSGRTGGKITVRHKGGGIKYLYTNIDFKYFNYNSTLALILKFYIDFSRTTIIMLILFLNGILKGTKKLYLSTNNLQIGDLISFSSKFPIKLGSYRYISQLFAGIDIHNLTNIPKGFSSVARAFGTKAKIIYHTHKYVCIKLPSGKFKLFHNNCLAVIGQNSIFYKRRKIKKAEFLKFKNLRPSVRGVAMNASDHPHGGGCGRTSVGLRSSKTPWGKIHYGVKTTPFKSYIKFRFI